MNTEYVIRFTILYFQTTVHRVDCLSFHVINLANLKKLSNLSQFGSVECPRWHPKFKWWFLHARRAAEPTENRSPVCSRSCIRKNFSFFNQIFTTAEAAELVCGHNSTQSLQSELVLAHAMVEDWQKHSGHNPRGKNSLTAVGKLHFSDPTVPLLETPIDEKIPQHTEPLSFASVRRIINLYLRGQKVVARGTANGGKTLAAIHQEIFGSCIVYVTCSERCSACFKA